VDKQKELRHLGRTVVDNWVTRFVFWVATALFGAIKSKAPDMATVEATIKAYWQWIPFLLVSLCIIGNALYKSLRAKPAGVSVIFKDSDLVMSSDEASKKHYVIYKGERRAISGYDLVKRAFPDRNYVEGRDLSILDPEIFRLIPEGRALKTEADVQEILFQRR
jgi:hypothetical protein